MKYIIVVLCLIVMGISASYKQVTPRPFKSTSLYTVVEKDSIGIIVEYKEKYGFFFVDTGTILMEDNRKYVLIKRDLSKKVMMKENLISIRWDKMK